MLLPRTDKQLIPRPVLFPQNSWSLISFPWMTCVGMLYTAEDDRDWRSRLQSGTGNPSLLLLLTTNPTRGLCVGQIGGKTGLCLTARRGYAGVSGWVLHFVIDSEHNLSEVSVTKWTLSCTHTCKKRQDTCCHKASKCPPKTKMQYFLHNISK